MKVPRQEVVLVKVVFWRPHRLMMSNILTHSITFLFSAKEKN